MILLRHGETPFNIVFGSSRKDPGIHDPPLTENGRQQITMAAERLRDDGVTRLVVSPYRRALESGAIIADRLKVPVTIDPLIRERFAYSCDVGTPVSTLKELWKQYVFDHLDEIWWPDAEEPEAGFDLRCRDFTAKMAALDDWRSVVAVTHWGVIRSLTGSTVENGAMVRFMPDAPGVEVAYATDPC